MSYYSQSKSPFPSPVPDRAPLPVSDAARELDLSYAKVIALIEAGALPAAYVNADRNSIPVPRSFIRVLAEEIGWTEERVMELLAKHRRTLPPGSHYRIPRESLREFIYRRADSERLKNSNPIG